MLRDYLNRLIASLARSEGHEPHPTEAHFTLRGFPVAVINERPDIATADAMHRLEAALDLIERYAPRRLP
jgi:hypothetical protein